MFGKQRRMIPTYGGGHRHSLARAAANGYRGLSEKIAPVSVRSLTA
jgi:hypothetical protein